MCFDCVFVNYFRSFKIKNCSYQFSTTVEESAKMTERLQIVELLITGAAGKKFDFLPLQITQNLSVFSRKLV